MPANTLFLPPDIQAQQQQLALQQAIAQQISQRASQGPDMSGWNSMRQVPKLGWGAGLSSMVSPLVAAMVQKNLLQKEFGINQQIYQRGQDEGSAAQSALRGPQIQMLPANQDSDGPTPLVQRGQGQTYQQTLDSAGKPDYDSFLTHAGRAAALGNPVYSNPEILKALVAEHGPTDATRMAIQAGLDPALANRDALRKANYVPPYETREGNTARDPFTNLPIATAPKVPAGYEPKYDAKGGLESIVPIPGGPQAVQGNAAATESGTQSQHPVKLGVDANGKDVYGFVTPPGIQPTGRPNYVSSTPQTLSLAGQTGQKEGGELGQKYSATLAANATGATEVRRGLSELRNLATQASPAASNTAKLKLGSYMIAAGASPQTVSGLLHVDVGALNAAVKQTASLAVSSIHSMTNRGTNFDLDTFMRNNPNLDMSDPSAFNRVVDYMDNKAKQEIAKQKDFVQWKKGVSPDEWEAGHTSHWLEKQNADIEAGASNSPNPHAKSAPMPSADKLAAYAKTHFRGDVNKAKAFLASQGYK